MPLALRLAQLLEQLPRANLGMLEVPRVPSGMLASRLQGLYRQLDGVTNRTQLASPYIQSALRIGLERRIQSVVSELKGLAGTPFDIRQLRDLRERRILRRLAAQHRPDQQRGPQASAHRFASTFPIVLRRCSAFQTSSGISGAAARKALYALWASSYIWSRSKASAFR